MATSQEPPTVLQDTILATVRSMASVPLEVQPDYPTLAETVRPSLAPWDARHAPDAVFEGWDTVTDGLALNWA